MRTPRAPAAPAALAAPASFFFRLWRFTSVYTEDLSSHGWGCQSLGKRRVLYLAEWIFCARFEQLWMPAEGNAWHRSVPKMPVPYLDLSQRAYSAPVDWQAHCSVIREISLYIHLIFLNLAFLRKTYTLADIIYGDGFALNRSIFTPNFQIIQYSLNSLP